MLVAPTDGPFRPTYLNLCRGLGLRRRFQLGDYLLTKDEQVVVWIPLDGMPAWSGPDAVWVPSLSQAWPMIARLGYREFQIRYVRGEGRRGEWLLEAKTPTGQTTFSREPSLEECVLRIARDHAAPGGSPKVF